MLNKPTAEFVSRHAHDDVGTLALRGCKDPDVDLNTALQQIQGRQRAQHKLPTWAAEDGIVYPPHINMEQCSSELTARHKAQIAEQKSKGCILADLTGGLGVDFAYMARHFQKAVYVERDKQLCHIAAHNFKTLGLNNVNTVCADAETILTAAEGRTGHCLNSGKEDGQGLFVYIDPARRDTNGARTYAIADCSPNVITMMQSLNAHADHVMLKLSPMLDWRKAIADLRQPASRMASAAPARHDSPLNVTQVHIVAVDNECKELLLLLSHEAAPLRLVCTDINSRKGTHTSYSPHLHTETAHRVCPTAGYSVCPTGPDFLYEPNAAVMKAGCFRELAADYGIAQLAANSHLFTADHLIEGFPGRCFHIEARCSMNKHELQTTLANLKHANIAVRNFPLTAKQLRTRLKLADGGNDYIFGTTLSDNSHILFLCKPNKTLA